MMNIEKVIIIENDAVKPSKALEIVEKVEHYIEQKKVIEERKKSKEQKDFKDMTFEEKLREYCQNIADTAHLYNVAEPYGFDEAFVEDATAHLLANLKEDDTFFNLFKQMYTFCFKYVKREVTPEYIDKLAGEMNDRVMKMYEEAVESGEYERWMKENGEMDEDGNLINQNNANNKN